MGPADRWVVPLAEAAQHGEASVGGKAVNLSRLAATGFRVPGGFCVTTNAYERFVAEGRLDQAIRMELGRKPFESMRWEEIWDGALRIRSSFVSTMVPPAIARDIRAGISGLGSDTPLAIRSSAPGEDSASGSFAGLHESYVDVVGEEAGLDAVRLVWASLWSDAALLYRQELSMDPAQSRMAVVVQEMIHEDRSGVAFGRDPRDTELDRAIVEAVPGPCSVLVDGDVDPDRWVLNRTSGEVVDWRRGERTEAGNEGPLLETGDLGNLLDAIHRVESGFGFAPDLEWTGRLERLTLLQARPISTGSESSDDPRSWYLSLRPKAGSLRALGKRVSEELIPQLAAEGRRLADESLDGMDDSELGSAIDERREVYEHWRGVYWDEFIPFSHGVRRLGTYYNDAVQPDDPYEFVGLLKGEQMIAGQRNGVLTGLASQVRANPDLAEALQVGLEGSEGGGEAWLADLGAAADAEAFREGLRDLMEGFMDVAYEGERLGERPDLVVRTLLEMARSETPSPCGEDGGTADAPVADLECKLLDAVGAERREEAEEVLETGRLSWRLRDDDNLLLGRVESQLLRAIDLGLERLAILGRVDGQEKATVEMARAVSDGLRNPMAGKVELPKAADSRSPDGTSPIPGVRPRQLIGQPGSKGMAAGRVRRIRGPEDLGRFRAGEVLVCDAIQPTMTHLVPLACAIVERRGGMLIHGAIIARELGIPCVNGVVDVVNLLDDGELVTVDGSLGIVTVGEPEFDLERGDPASGERGDPRYP